MKFCIAANRNDGHVSERKTWFRKMLLFSAGIKSRQKNLPAVFCR